MNLLLVSLGCLCETRRPHVLFGCSAAARIWPMRGAVNTQSMVHSGFGTRVGTHKISLANTSRQKPGSPGKIGQNAGEGTPPFFSGLRRASCACAWGRCVLDWRLPGQRRPCGPSASAVASRRRSENLELGPGPPAKRPTSHPLCWSGGFPY